MVAVLNLQLDKAMAEKGRALSEGQDTNEQVHKAVQESVGSGRIGNLKVDPRYLVFEPQSRELVELASTDRNEALFLSVDASRKLRSLLFATPINLLWFTFSHIKLGKRFGRFNSKFRLL